MRLGVLDVGSNTVHLLVVDAHRGAQPTPQLSQQERAAAGRAHRREGRSVQTCGADALVEAVADAKHDAKELGCDELLAFATSAVRDARNAAEVLGRVVKETGVELSVLSGEDEARLTFLAVRRWLGWSAGNLICLDIGGGSLELAAGCDEEPAVAFSLPLGAARLTREWFDARPARQAVGRRAARARRGAAGQAGAGAAGRRRAGPRRRHQQDLPHARPAGRRGAELGGSASAPACSPAPGWRR